MDGAKFVDAILEFLRNNQFTKAEAALRSEIRNRGDVDDLFSNVAFREKELCDTLAEVNLGRTSRSVNLSFKGLVNTEMEHVVEEVGSERRRKEHENGWKASTSARELSTIDVDAPRDQDSTVINVDNDIPLGFYSSNADGGQHTPFHSSNGAFDTENSLATNQDYTGDIRNCSNHISEHGSSGKAIAGSVTENIKKRITVDLDPQHTVFLPCNEQEAADPFILKDELTPQPSSNPWKDYFAVPDPALSLDDASISAGRECLITEREQMNGVHNKLPQGRSQWFFCNKNFELPVVNQKEELPQLPPVRLKSYEKPLQVIWDDRIEKNDLDLTNTATDNTFHIQPYLDVPVGQDVTSSDARRIAGGNWLSVSRGISEDASDLVSGFATIGDGLSETVDYPNEYWDSDEYEDDDDVGYTRQPIEDEAWFLSHEVDDPSDSEKAAASAPNDDADASFAQADSYFSGERFLHGRNEDRGDVSGQYDADRPQDLSLVCAEPVWQGFVTRTSESGNGRVIPDDDDDRRQRVRSIGVGISSDASSDAQEESASWTFHNDLRCFVNDDGGEREEAGGRFPSAEDEEAAAVQEQMRQIRAHEEEFEVFNLKVFHRRNRTGFEEDKNFNVVLNSVLAGRYHVAEYLGSAAFSKAVQAHDLHTGMDVCIKIIKNNKDFFDQSLDEIKLLKFVNRHDPGDSHHVLRLYDYFYYREHLLIVCELLKANLYEFHKFNRESGGEVYFTMPRLQSISVQCLEALEFLHGLGLIHCDLKPENILVKSYSRCEVKVIDLGSSCFRSDHLCSYVQSRSYRAPEVILGLPYDHKIDIWSLGCILAELCTGNVLFQNDSSATLLARVIGIIGSVERGMLVRGRDTCKYFTRSHMLYERNPETNRLEYLIPKKTTLRHRLPMGDQGFVDFVAHLLEINPKRRPSAASALRHPWLSYPYEPISS